MPPCCHELWDPLSCCPAMKVMTGCTTVVGVSVKSTCCTCTGAGAGNLGWVAIKPWYLGFPVGVPRIWGVPGAKAGHTWHCCCRKTDDIICHTAEVMVTASWAVGLVHQPWQRVLKPKELKIHMVVDPKKQTEEAVPWSSCLATAAAWSHHPLSVVDSPGPSCLCSFPIADHWK